MLDLDAPLSADVLLRWYSYRQLAVRWHVSVDSLKQWVCRDRAAGCPIISHYRFARGHRRRELLIRGDSVLALFARHVRVDLRGLGPRGA